MTKFRKKPVVIEAWRFKKEVPIPIWVARKAHDLGDGNLSFGTLEGVMVANPGFFLNFVISQLLRYTNSPSARFPPGH